MNEPGWFRGQIAKFVAAGGLGIAIGFGTLAVAHAAALPSPTVTPDVGASPSTGVSPSTGASPSTSPGTGSGSSHMNCPNM